MTKIVDEKIARYWAMKPIVYGVLKSLTLSQYLDSNGWVKQQVTVVLAKDLENHEELLHLTFYEVRNCQIQQPWTTNIVLCPVEILPGYSLPQIESEYLVRDPEQERILWFECGDFEARMQ